MLNDLRYALRTMARNPAFSLVTVLTLALGIGATTAIFSVVNAVLLEPLPYPRSDRLVDLSSTALGGRARMGVSYPDVLEMRAMTRDLSGVAAYTTQRANMTGLGDPREVQLAIVSPELFKVLDVHPQIGRTLAPGDAKQPVAVLSYGTWASTYGRDPGVLGKTITLDGRTYTVIGVMPPSMQFPDEHAALWLPIGAAFLDDPTLEVNEHYEAFGVVGRLAPRATMAHLAASLAALAERRNAETPAAGNGARREARIVARSSGPGAGGPPVVSGKNRELQTGFSAELLNRTQVADSRTPLLVLFGAVGVVMLIACVNAAGLLLARASGRRREIAVRRAIGAGRGRIVRQLLTESVLLSLVAGAVGLVLAWLGLRVLLDTWPAVLPRAAAIGIDGRVLMFTLVLAVLTGVGFSLLPALRAAAPDVERTLRDDTAASVGAKRHTQGILIVVEMALALMLLVGAGLLVRSFVSLSDVDPGFDPLNVLAARIRLTPTRYANVEQQREFFDQVQTALASQPGVLRVSVSRTLPLSGALMMLAMNLHAVRPDDPEPMLVMQLDVVGAGYFNALRVPLEGGRAFSAADRSDAPKVAIVNDLLAKRLWPGESPIGKQIPVHTPGGPGYDATVVGEIGPLRSGALDRPPQPALYLPAAQASELPQMWIEVRAAARPLRLAAALRAAVARVDPQQPIGEIVSLEQLVARQTAARRLTMALVSLFAALAMTLAAIGMYGVGAYAVARRTREFGIRAALGARPRDVLALVLGEHLQLVAAGAAIGLVMAAALTRVLRSMLFDVSPTDAVTFAATALLLAAVAMLAAFVPARRAARVDPMVALRHE